MIETLAFVVVFIPCFRVTVILRKYTTWYRNFKYLSGVKLPRGEMKVVVFEPLVMVSSALCIEVEM